MKCNLRRKLGYHFATYKELCTVLAEIEGYLNSRLLCALFGEPFNPKYLCPGHFQMGEPLTQFPAADFTDVKCNRISLWKTYQQHLQELWQNWPSDYLQNLQQRQRCRGLSPT